LTVTLSISKCTALPSEMHLFHVSDAPDPGPKGQTPKLYVYFPIPLAAAIGLQPGEEVEWELLHRGELHLVRPHAPPPPHSCHHRPSGLNFFDTVSAAQPSRPRQRKPDKSGLPLHLSAFFPVQL
jgi:hypothetical protein